MILSKVVSVAKSCKTIEQLAHCFIWVGRVLPKEDVYKFVNQMESVPNFYVAVSVARDIIYGEVST
jgi:hypothetical protein